MTDEQIVELHKRIRAEAAGLTLDQAEEQCEAARRIADLPGSTDEQYATYEEWYGICYVMQPLPPGAGGQPGMDAYDPREDGRPL
jgi:hypothetical protein